MHARRRRDHAAGLRPRDEDRQGALELTLLRDRLEALSRATDAETRLRADPIAFPRRYGDAGDREIAAVVASQLAYGRVDLFRPVVAAVLAEADLHGGPRAYVERFDPGRHASALRPLVYRWNRGIDLILLFATLRETLERYGRLEDVFAGTGAREALTAGVDVLRAVAVEVAPRCGVEAAAFADLPRGFRYLLPSPADGSACKRWNMLLRWLVRPPSDGVDLGLWTRLRPRDLVIPLDTHVGRIARFVGLTRRTDGSWRTAAEVTDALRRLDPDDPVRFDFALAHLGISGACRGRRDEAVCPSCPLVEVCAA